MIATRHWRPHGCTRQNEDVLDDSPKLRRFGRHLVFMLGNLAITDQSHLIRTTFRPCEHDPREAVDEGQHADIIRSVVAAPKTGNLQNFHISALQTLCGQAFAGVHHILKAEDMVKSEEKSRRGATPDGFPIHMYL
jgi:hypothetical protein